MFKRDKEIETSHVPLKPLQYTSVKSDAEAPPIGAWTPWDLSAIIPTGAKAVEVVALGEGFAQVGVRPSGSTINRFVGIGAEGILLSTSIHCEVGNNRTIEIYSGPVVYFFYIFGYWRPS